ncbi:MAG: methionyl-tRNA formyltransferase [Muribaculaceae bacterium]|nr:methionyl-tRNA formyltransferase [Muribaculaceae bacterium]
MTKEDLKIVFFGTPDFAVESLGRLVDGGYNVAAVVTMPDKPAGRGRQLQQSDVKRYAVEHGLPVLQPVSLKDEAFIEELRSLGAQLFIVIAFRMLPEAVWQMPSLGTFNLHASLLPRYRGAAPINWAVINGDTETGVTTFFLKHEIDTGDIIQQRSCPIGRHDNVEDIHDRLMVMGAGMVIETVDAIIDGTVKPIPQDQMLTAGQRPTPAPKIFKDTCRIDWHRPAEELYNHIRGLSPYPAAWTTLTDESGKEITTLKIYQTSEPIAFATGENPAPGAMRADRKTLCVACGDSWLQVLSLQQSGKKRMDTDAFLRGFTITPSTSCR